MSKKDKILIVVTVVLLIVLIGGFVWDYNKFVLDRTLKIEITDDMKVVAMNKVGILYYRKAYEAKIQIPAERAEDMLNVIANNYEGELNIMDFDSFQEYAAGLFNSEVLKPSPMYGTEVAEIRAVDGDHDVTFFIDIETETDAYIYVYYLR